MRLFPLNRVRAAGRLLARVLHVADLVAVFGLAGLVALLIKTVGWTQKVYARTAKGKRCAPTSPNAAAFCIAGACRAACGDDRVIVNKVRGLIIDALDKRGFVDVGNWNDDPARRKAHVVALLRRVAAAVPRG